VACARGDSVTDVSLRSSCNKTAKFRLGKVTFEHVSRLPWPFFNVHTGSMLDEDRNKDESFGRMMEPSSTGLPELCRSAL